MAASAGTPVARPAPAAAVGPPPGEGPRRGRGASRIQWDRVGRIALSLVLLAVLYSYFNPVIDLVRALTATTAAKADLHEALAREQAPALARASTPTTRSSSTPRRAARAFVRPGETHYVVRGHGRCAPAGTPPAMIGAGSYLLSAAALAALALSLGFSANRLRRPPHPGLGGSPGAPRRGNHGPRPADLVSRAPRNLRESLYAWTLGSFKPGGRPGRSLGASDPQRPPADPPRATTTPSRQDPRRRGRWELMVMTGVIALVVAHWGLWTDSRPEQRHVQLRLPLVPHALRRGHRPEPLGHPASTTPRRSSPTGSTRRTRSCCTPSGSWSPSATRSRSSSTTAGWRSRSSPPGASAGPTGGATSASSPSRSCSRATS